MAEIGIPFPDIDPIAFSIGNFLHIRWYALAYLTGFLGGWKYALHLTNIYTHKAPSRDDIDNLLPWLVLGVVLGGRLGYVVFYNLPYYLDNPLSIPLIWEGGMSFHGGFLGVMTAIFCFTKYHKFSFLRLCDIIACVAPIGLFFGRIANFINAELYGRVTTVSWGVVFPNGGVLPRHPSQFYEALLEGFCLLLIMGVLVRNENIRKRSGVLSGTFVLGYGISRFIVEFFREPDLHLGLFYDFFSRGQLLSLPMIFVGLVLIFYSWQKYEANKNKQIISAP